MTIQTYRRLDLAKNQLETAIGLFVSGRDRFSVITLAGAADGILTQLVQNKKAETFVAAVLKDEEDKAMTLGAMGRHINNILFINALKHLDEGDDVYVTVDVEQCALAAILKTIPNLITLCGREIDFVRAFMAWVKLNLDPRIYNVDCDPDWKPSLPSSTNVAPTAPVP
jgi:hypothetical protein